MTPLGIAALVLFMVLVAALSAAAQEPPSETADYTDELLRRAEAVSVPPPHVTSGRPPMFRGRGAEQEKLEGPPARPSRGPGMDRPALEPFDL